MKKVFVLMLAIAGLSLTACKKDYTCDCTDNGGNAVNYDNLSKENADEFQTNCENSGCTWSQQ